MKYKLKRHSEKIGDLVLEIETLEDLDAVIDELCESAPKDSQARILEDLCPYFGVVWPAARALSQHLSRMGAWLRGKTVLEVGCGLALPSLVAARLGATVTATDFHPDVPQFLERNLALNQIEVKYRVLNWRNTAEASALGTFDFVIGSDIAYEAGQAKLLAETLASLCHKQSHILLADPGRPYFQELVDAVMSRGFYDDLFVTKVDTTEVFLASLTKK